MFHKCVAVFTILALFCAASETAAGTVESHLSGSDVARLQTVFKDSLASSDLQSIYYASLNVEATNAKELCKQLVDLHKNSKLNAFEKDFYLVGSHKSLRCTEKLPESLLNEIYAVFKKDLSSPAEIYYRVATHKLLGVQINEQTNAKIAKNLEELLRKDDTLNGLGYAFNVAVELGKPAAFVANRVEDAFAQADEVDGKILQFEGGLSITALLVNGGVKVAKTFLKPFPFNEDQARKFANYFLGRRSVQSAKGAHLLIENLKLLSSTEKLAPICIQLVGSGQLQDDAAKLSIAVVDLMGKPLTPAPKNVVGKITKNEDKTVLADKVAFEAKSSDKTVFVADLSNAKPSRGVYTVDVSVTGGYQQKLQFKILGRAVVQSLEIGIAESEAGGNSGYQKHTLTYPNKLQEVISADSTQKLLMKTVLTDENTKKIISVHQAFVLLYNKETDQEVVFIAEQDSNKAYKFDMDIGAHAAEFGQKTGLYEIYLIIGDSLLSNSFKWHLANINLKFPADEKEVKKEQVGVPLPEIEHQFRVPEKRPRRIVSDVFTGLCLTPLVLFIFSWGKLGINVSNFSFAPSTLGFHLGLGGILGLFGVFWYGLNMFQTLRLLIPIAFVTFLCGNRLLRRLYAKRISKGSS